MANGVDERSQMHRESRSSGIRAPPLLGCMVSICTVKGQSNQHRHGPGCRWVDGPQPACCHPGRGRSSGFMLPISSDENTCWHHQLTVAQKGPPPGANGSDISVVEERDGRG